MTTKVSLTVQRLHEIADKLKPGFLDECSANGEFVGEMFIVDTLKWNALVNSYLFGRVAKPFDGVNLIPNLSDGCCGR
jgi:hypothetical protein